ncbi:MAG: D-alanyl-D-alanine carboxypeptidase [Desulfurivibrionaceae bacterium]|nr:D-alanyl-D-alanine carboxypeptidase [Desulfobulbales bacterium]MDT8335556.1 D-alanyl-D-alanine carboxypeptidase [Desulfurivibrionaceae bacterium]
MKLLERIVFHAFVLPAIVLAAVSIAPEVEARSSRKQILSIDTTHKFKPGAAPSGIPGYGYRSPVADLSSAQQVKRRPDEGLPFPPTADQLRKTLTSRSAIVMEADTGNVIYAHSPDVPAQPASTIKILTGLIAIQSLDKEDLVVASRRAAGMPSSKIYLRDGESYRVDDMINAVLISSANDASVALAEKIAGSERVFAKLMTHKAMAWGAKETVCKTASGLTAFGQKSTVRDLAVLFNRAMDNAEFADRIARTKVKTGDGKLLRNHNRALWQIDGAEGGKTGYTRAARQTYVGKFKRGDDELTVAVMGSETMWDDVKHLVEYGFATKRSMGMTTAAVN